MNFSEVFQNKFEPSSHCCISVVVFVIGIGKPTTFILFLCLFSSVLLVSGFELAIFCGLHFPKNETCFRFLVRIACYVLYYMWQPPSIPEENKVPSCSWKFLITLLKDFSRSYTAGRQVSHSKDRPD